MVIICGVQAASVPSPVQFGHHNSFHVTIMVDNMDGVLYTDMSFATVLNS